MKNLLFALLLWEEDIVEVEGAVVIYLDNASIERKGNEYGTRARDFIQHLRKCEGVKIQYNVRGSKSMNNIEDFAKYIQPADDFSRKKIVHGLGFLERAYGLTTSQGAYYPKVIFQREYRRILAQSFNLTKAHQVKILVVNVTTMYASRNKFLGMMNLLILKKE
jgi:hypothetical protein